MIDRLVGEKVIGIKQSKKAIESGKGTVLYVAKDTEKKLISLLLELAFKNEIKVIEIDTMRNLGKMCGIDVKCAATLLLK